MVLEIDGVKEGNMTNGEGMVQEEPLSPTARLFQSPRLNCCIIAVIGCKTRIDVDTVKMGLEHTLVKHPRFSSLLVMGDKKDGKKMWTRTSVNIENHLYNPDLDPNMDSPDQFVEDYISNLTKSPMDLTKPLWELHILNVKTSDSSAVAVFKIHHSMGDGMSLISLLLACSRKTSDPEALPSIPTSKRAGLRNSGGAGWRVLFGVWIMLAMMWNTLVDVVLFIATTLFLRDTDTPLKGGPGVEFTPKRLVHRILCLNDIKLVKNAMNTIYCWRAMAVVAVSALPLRLINFLGQTPIVNK